jgi:F-type H+-transporting ATPase subunit delta
MTTDRIRSYADAIVAFAGGEDALDAVEDELLSLARAIDGSDELRRRLTGIHLPVANRLAFVESELLRAAHPATRSALSLVIAAERVGGLAKIADEVARRAAAAREEELAEVYVAVPLDKKRETALKQALERVTGKKLELKVYVDDSVVGGVRARIGDTVIDGSVARRLTDLRTRLGG